MWLVDVYEKKQLTLIRQTIACVETAREVVKRKIYSSPLHEWKSREYSQTHETNEKEIKDKVCVCVPKKRAKRKAVYS